MDSSNELRMMVYASLFAALTAVGAFLAIPIGPVPIVLQNMFVYLAGGRWGLASVGVYLLAGACGLPVFAGGLGGISRFIGPTGGYLIGYLPAVFLIGKISFLKKPIRGSFPMCWR
jgi:biotin transport system substrate-specific component